jgi:DNA-binding CsgD family transcriptional regulator
MSAPHPHALRTIDAPAFHSPAGSATSVHRTHVDLPVRTGPRPAFAVASAPEVEVLERFDVPYLVLRADGALVHVSPRAVALFSTAAELDAVLRQSARLAADLLGTSGAPARVDHGGAVSMPSCRAGTNLVAHRLRLPMQDTMVLVALTPSPVPEHTRSASDSWRLTTREADVAWLLAEGLSSKEIGRALGISAHTARRHTERVFSKLGVSGRVEATAMLVRWASRQ